MRERNQLQKRKTLKLIKNKLSPMTQDNKLPFGRQNFLKLKNVKTIPKLKKKHFTQINTKSYIDQILQSSNIIEDQKENQDQVGQAIYKKPEKWLEIWKKTGDQLQHQFLLNQSCEINKKIIPKYIVRSPDFKLKGKQRTSFLPDFSKTTREVLKKVENFKIMKNKQLQNQQKSYLSKKSCKTTKNTTKRREQYQKNTQQEENKKVRKKDQDWITFITDLILKKNIESSQEDKIFAQYKDRKRQNRIKQFINIFQKQQKTTRNCPTKTNRTCHLENLTSPCYRMEDFCLKDSLCESRQRVIECNNPVFKLRRLQSLCKLADTSKEILPQKIENHFGFTSEKLRINSNHKKIINTQR